MNAIAAHRNELERLLMDLSGDIAVSEISFAALLDDYITRLDKKSPRHQCPRQPAASANKRRIKYGTNIDSELRALLRPT
jgi:hypothetical protein